MTWDASEYWWVLTGAWAVFVALQLVGLFSAFHALSHVRTSQAAVAWTVGLITFPLIAIPMYWVLARHRFEGYREAIRDIGTRHQKSVQAVQNELQTGELERSTKQHSALERLADILDTPLSSADRAELLIDGEAFFDAILSEIEAAKQYVYVAFYILRDDGIGRRFADALIRKASRGVTVRVLYDEVGCLRLPRKYLDKLRASGVDVHPFNTRQGWINRFQLNFRNHRKLVLVDGHTAIVGGFNVGDEYLGPSANMPPWRDTAVLVKGAITRKVQAVFAGDYYWAARSDLPEASWAKPESPDPGLRTARTASQLSDSQDNEDAQMQFASIDQLDAAVCATGPADRRPRATMMFGALAGSAQERLWISTPYLVPDDPSIVALHMARARGVDVRILIPNHADHWAVYLAGFHYAHEMTEAKIQVDRFTEGFLHQKCILVDDELALIGSTNLDNRSLYLNFELMVAIQKPEFVSQVRDMLELDFANATPCYSKESPPRWWFERAGTAIARLFSPML